MRIIKAGALTLLIFSVVACAGKTAQPVSSYKVGDSEMSCNQLKAEMAHIDARVAELVPESEKTGKNVALGVTGAFLIVPLFFMDFSDAEKIEIQSYKERYLALEKLYSQKSCTGAADIDSAEQNPSSVSERLQALNELHDQGLISDEEYEKYRKEIMGSI